MVVRKHGAFPDWAQAYIPPHRHKVAYGGRGSSKSWTFARLLVALGAHKRIRVLAARELQNSIKDSVLYLLISQIEALGLENYYSWGENFLRGRNGTDFVFKGLRHNIKEVKSTEDIDICWVEEAQNVSELSWRTLIPTIRAPGSEIWVTFNPDTADDPTYKRFVLNPPPDTVLTKVNWNRNPWLSKELNDERLYLMRVDPDAYANVWGGEPVSYSSAQIFSEKWSVDRFEPGEDWDGPYYGADWGFSTDPTTLVKVWIHGRKLYIEREMWRVKLELDNIAGEFYRVMGEGDIQFKKRLIRADQSRPDTISKVRSTPLNDRMGSFKLRVMGAEKWPGSVEEGITFLRSFEEIIIHERCTHAQFEARNYKHKVDRLTEDVLPDIVDKHNHIWDGVRYALQPMIRNRRGNYAGAMVRSH